MPLDAPVTIATLLDSRLIFTIVPDPTPNVHRCELRLARMKISIYGPNAKERFETARQRSFLHPERSVTNPCNVRIARDTLGTACEAATLTLAKLVEVLVDECRRK